MTDEIAFRDSLKLNRFARMNSNRIRPGFEDLINRQMSIRRVTADNYPMSGHVEVYAYGFHSHPVFPKI